MLRSMSSHMVTAMGVLFVAAIALLSLAACGDDPSSKTPSSTTTTGNASAALLPRNTVVPVSVVIRYFPDVTEEAIEIGGMNCLPLASAGALFLPAMSQPVERAQIFL